MKKILLGLMCCTFSAQASSLYTTYTNNFIKVCDNKKLTTNQKRLQLSHYVNYAKKEIAHQNKWIPDSLESLALQQLSEVQDQINQNDFQTSKHQAIWLRRFFTATLGGSK